MWNANEAPHFKRDLAGTKHLEFFHTQNTDQDIDLKMQSRQHMDISAPLNRGEMYALIVYTSQSPIHSFATKSIFATQEFGDYETWKWFDLCLHSAIVKLSKVDQPSFPIFTVQSNDERRLSKFRSSYRDACSKSTAMSYVKQDESRVFEIDSRLKDTWDLECCNVGWIQNRNDTQRVLIARRVPRSAASAIPRAQTLQPSVEPQQLRDSVRRMELKAVEFETKLGLTQACPGHAQSPKSLSDPLLRVTEKDTEIEALRHQNKLSNAQITCLDRDLTKSTDILEKTISQSKKSDRRQTETIIALSSQLEQATKEHANKMRQNIEEMEAMKQNIIKQEALYAEKDLEAARLRQKVDVMEGEIRRLQNATHSDFITIEQFRAQLTALKAQSRDGEEINTLVGVQRQDLDQTVDESADITAHQSNSSETIVPGSDLTVQDREWSSSSECQRWFEWRGLVVALASCFFVMLVFAVVLCAKRYRKDHSDNNPSSQQPIDDRNGLAQLQEMSMYMRKNAPKEGAFGMAEIGPPTRREGASEIRFADVIVETPRDDTEDGATLTTQ